MQVSEKSIFCPESVFSFQYVIFQTSFFFCGKTPTLYLKRLQVCVNQTYTCNILRKGKEALIRYLFFNQSWFLFCIYFGLHICAQTLVLNEVHHQTKTCNLTNKHDIVYFYKDQLDLLAYFRILKSFKYKTSSEDFRKFMSLGLKSTKNHLYFAKGGSKMTMQKTVNTRPFPKFALCKLHVISLSCFHICGKGPLITGCKQQ